MKHDKRKTNGLSVQVSGTNLLGHDGVVISLPRHAAEVQAVAVAQGEVCHLCRTTEVTLELKAIGADTTDVTTALPARSSLVNHHHDVAEESANALVYNTHSCVPE